MKKCRMNSLKNLLSLMVANRDIMRDAKVLYLITNEDIFNLYLEQYEYDISDQKEVKEAYRDFQIGEFLVNFLFFLDIDKVAKFVIN